MRLVGENGLLVFTGEDASQFEADEMRLCFLCGFRLAGTRDTMFPDEIRADPFIDFLPRYERASTLA
jgi:hypothetical protein